MTLTDAGYGDLFLARFDAGGTLRWAKRARVNSSPAASIGISFSVAALPDEGALVTGTFFSPATFGPGEAGQAILTTPGGPFAAFLARYNADGTLRWAKRAGGDPSSFAQGISVAALPDGEALATGTYFGTATFGPGEPGEALLTGAGTGGGMFLARYHADGTLRWATRAGVGAVGYEVAALPDGGALVTGFFGGTATFGDVQTLTSAGGNDVFLARYGPDGALLWAVRAGGRQR